MYGKQRTGKGPFRVSHMIGHQGTRYEVDRAHEAKLESEVAAGQQRITQWLSARGGSGGAHA